MDNKCVEINYELRSLLTDEFKYFELDLLGVSEIHLPGLEKTKVVHIELVDSGRKDGVDRK